MNQNLDPAAAIASLRMIGADQFDPVRFHFLEVLAQRALEHNGEVKRILEGKLAKAQTAYLEHFEQTQNQSRTPQINTHNTQCSLLSALTRDIEQQSKQDVDFGVEENASAHTEPELKSIRHFRKTWSTLSVDKQLTQAFASGPENAGPLNSHLLVLRSLALMRDISPDYLNRFMSYIDTLIWLDTADSSVKPPVKKSRVRRKQ